MIDVEAVADFMCQWGDSVNLPVSYRDGKNAMFPTAGARLQWAFSTIANVGHEGIAFGSAPTVQGNRLVTLSCHVESMHNLPDPRCSEYLADRLRTRLKTPTMQSALHAAGMGLATVSPTVSVNPTWDDRIRSVTQFDALFNMVSTETDETLDTIGVVEVEYDIDNGRLIRAYTLNVD